VREDDRLQGTPLLLVVISIVLADIAFAVDSVPAALAVTRDAGVIWTANAFALLGLGAFLALVDILVRRFRYLDETIALILAFVGLKILFADLVPIGDVASLAVIALLLTAGSRLRRSRTDSIRPSRPKAPRDGRLAAHPRLCEYSQLTDAASLSRGVASAIKRWRSALIWIRSS